MKTGKFLATLCLMVSGAHAAVVTLVSGDPEGFSSFNSGKNWSDGQAPRAGNDYEVSGFENINSPTGSGRYVFGGDSL